VSLALSVRRGRALGAIPGPPGGFELDVDPLDYMVAAAEKDLPVPEDYEHRKAAKKVLKRIIESGSHVDEIIAHMGEVGAIDDMLLDVTRQRLKVAKEDAVKIGTTRDKAIMECLEVVLERLESEVAKNTSSEAMRLFNDLLEQAMNGGTSEDALEMMMEAFAGPAPSVMAVDVMDISRKIAEDGEDAGPRERVKRGDFEAEVSSLVSQAEEALAAGAPEGMDEEAYKGQRQQAEFLVGQMKDMLRIAQQLPDYDDIDQAYDDLPDMPF